MSLYLEGEDLKDFGLTANPASVVTFEMELNKSAA